MRPIQSPNTTLKNNTAVKPVALRATTLGSAVQVRKAATSTAQVMQQRVVAVDKPDNAAILK